MKMIKEIQMSPTICGSFAERDVQLKASYTCSLPRSGRRLVKMIKEIRSLSVKEPYDFGLLCGKRRAF